MERANDTALESDGGNESIKEPFQVIDEKEDSSVEDFLQEIVKPFAEGLQAAYDKVSQEEVSFMQPFVRPRNIIFCGSGEPFTAIYGSFRTTLPSADEQRAGFYHPEANRIIAAYPSKYKRFQKLGDI